MDFREYIAQIGVFLLFCFEIVATESDSVLRFKGGSRRLKSVAIFRSCQKVMYCLLKSPRGVFKALFMLQLIVLN